MTKRPLGCLFEVVETLVLTLVIFVVIQNFVAQPYKVQQESMEMTLLPDQYVLVDKLTPHVEPYRRGDIVVFTPPEQWAPGDGTPYIKRVIGVPGDTVELHDGNVFVNGDQLAEPYIYPGQVTKPLTDVSTWTVQTDQLFLMGDHRENSMDSRQFGPVELRNVIGRAWLRYFPFDVFSVLQRPTYGPTALAPRPIADLHRDPRAAAIASGRLAASP